jgi:hypothetical protein
VKKLLKAVEPYHKVIGSPSEAISKGISHKCYTPMVATLNNLRIDPIDFMIRGSITGGEAPFALVRPTIFRNNVCLIPDAFTKNYPQFASDNFVNGIALIAAVAMRIGGKTESITPHRYTKSTKG